MKNLLKNNFNIFLEQNSKFEFFHFFSKDLSRKSGLF